MSEFYDNDDVGFEDGGERVPTVGPEEIVEPTFLGSFGGEDVAEVSSDDLSPEEIEHAAIRQAAREQMEDFKRIFIRPMVAWRALPSDCLLFANGFGYLIGCASQMDIVKRHGGGEEVKANVNKYIVKYQRAQGTGSLPGQRGTEARLNMKGARENQLSNEVHPEGCQCQSCI